MAEKADLGLIGLGVMGRNLVLNMRDHGWTVAVFNRTVSAVDDLLDEESGKGGLIGARSVEGLVAGLRRPRKVMLMVPAGQPVDDLIQQLVPLLEPGDVLIDGGNSDYRETIRRAALVEANGLLYVGAGVSGGEDGARNGPSIMPGGSPAAWPLVKSILRSIAARVEDGTPCCDWVGENGAGHFVKMVHNGIEYGDMQLICEAYQLLKDGLRFDHDQMQRIFAEWNEVELDSYLIEITSHILGYRDQDGEPLLEKILDAAGQKGTGKWTAVTSLDLGIPLTLITEAVQARFVSALKSERVAAENILQGPDLEYKGNRDEFVDDLSQALYASKIMSYAQGYMLMRSAAEAYDWELDFGGIALMWRNGCIIRSVFLDRIKEAYDRDPGLKNLILDPYFVEQLHQTQGAWRRVVARAFELGIPVPSMSSGLAFYDGYRQGRLPANLLQAQRDYFGAHTYERVDRPRGEFFHTEWAG
ncbi:MAG: decarboxylating NADP(+)-dependent phosphogluconate dehydrogenase [Holophagae bacterium]|jgi:6-phosphogluconate dehydrogenase